MKKPIAGEWWRANDGSENAFICGSDHKGDPVVEIDGIVYHYQISAFLSLWHHEPRCTGWDWVEPLAVDPGEGYELLSAGTMLERSDQVLEKNGWHSTCYPGERVGSRNGLEGPYRRKFKPAETWPKWYVHSDSTESWYVRRDRDDATIHGNGADHERVWVWDLLSEDYVKCGNWLEVTEAEALARVTPNPKPKFCVMCGVNFVVPGTASCDECMEYAIAATGSPVESPDDWVTQDRVPVRIGKDQFNWGGGSVLWNDVRQSHIDDYGSELRHGWVDPDDDYVAHVRCRHKDLPVVFDPQTFTSDWGPHPSDTHPRYQSDSTCSIAASEQERFVGRAIGLQFAIAELRSEVTVDVCQECPRLVTLALDGLLAKADFLVEQMKAACVEVTE